jgi:hypothetical protein
MSTVKIWVIAKNQGCTPLVFAPTVEVVDRPLTESSDLPLHHTTHAYQAPQLLSILSWDPSLSQIRKIPF